MRNSIGVDWYNCETSCLSRVLSNDLNQTDVTRIKKKKTFKFTNTFVKSRRVSIFLHRYRSFFSTNQMAKKTQPIDMAQVVL